MKPEEMATLPLLLEKQFYELQDRIMSDVVRRLRKTGGITSTADYQLNKVLMLGGTTEFIESEIKRLAGLADSQLWEIYDTVAEKDYMRMRSVYEQVNGNFIPYEENHVLQQWADAIVRQTKGDLKNITGSLGFQVPIGGGKKAFTPLTEYYQRYLDRACQDVVTGSFDYNTVLRRVVREMAASGLQTVGYASGYSCRAPVAARRAVLSGVHQLTAKMNEAVAKDLGTDYFEVTAHAGARPSHAVWQGRVYSRQDLEDVCGLGDVAGLCGANCRHSYYAFLPGISSRAYPDDYLEELREEDERIRTFGGREYDGYGATQRQRQYETTMRGQRAAIRQLKEGRAPEEDVQAAQARYLNTLHEYQRFSKAMDLEPQMERVYMDGLGRMAGGRIPTRAAASHARVTVSHVKAVEKPADSAILKTAKTKEVIEVHSVGRINREIYKCVTADIVTDEVIITDNQIQHIRERHPDDYERFSKYFSEILSSPDYIIEANKPDTAVILKEIVDRDERFQTVLRLCTSKEPEGYKNSIITFLKIDEKRWNRYLRTKRILYKKE